MADNRFLLKGGEVHVTDDETCAYKVISGTMLIYVVPMKNGKPGRRSFIYQAECGEVIPSFSYKDIEYCQWRFCFSAVDIASVQVIENGSTKILKEKFARKAGLKNYSREGYNGALVDQYRLNVVTEDGFIRRTRNQRTDTAENVRMLIYNSFKKKGSIAAESSDSPDLLYNAMCILGNKVGVKIASYDKIRAVCKDKTSVPEIARISHFAYREIVLEPGWEKEDGGSFVTFNGQNKPIVCLSKGTHTYMLWDVENNCTLPCNKKVVSTLNPKGYMIYTPFPNNALTRKDMVRFCVGQIRKADVIMLLLLTLATSLLGILTPTLSQSIYDSYIPLGAVGMLYQIGCMLAAFMLSNLMFSIVKNISSFRISTRIGYAVQDAVYDRLFNLPESFFREYDSADLAQRVVSAGAITRSVVDLVVSALMSLIFAVVYFVRMISYSVPMSLIGLLMLLVYASANFLITVRALKYNEKALELDGKTSSVMYQFLNGISKIRIAGIEDRAVYEYLKPYVEQNECEQKQERIMDTGAVLGLIANSIFSIVFYCIVVGSNSGISLGSFIAFNTMFGSFSSVFLQLVNSFISYKSIKPGIERLRPVLAQCPESDEAKELPGDISGDIEINNVSFAYGEDMPYVLSDISLNINQGEYIGIVGPSGCGKSTLIKLLLGFEKPSVGKIYYDNKDIESLDKRELRKKMGVVLQNGHLISGSIFENITITAPDATLQEVVQAVEAVGLKEDIDAMPMGLHTILSEDSSTISGGQQQRILIARAIISNPQILIFDEATSALDNITQRMVCDTLEAMHGTRIVIAHRLSTIMRCDRIVVLDEGRIAEQGTYDELMSNKGLFHTLASRQMA